MPIFFSHCEVCLWSSIYLNNRHVLWLGPRMIIFIYFHLNITRVNDLLKKQLFLYENFPTFKKCESQTQLLIRRSARAGFYPMVLHPIVDFYLGSHDEWGWWRSWWWWWRITSTEPGLITISWAGASICNDSTWVGSNSEPHSNLTHL